MAASLLYQTVDPLCVDKERSGSSIVLEPDLMGFVSEHKEPKGSVLAKDCH